MTPPRSLSLVRFAALATLSLGSVVLVGWALDWVYLKSVLPGLTAMNPATAVALIASGTALIQLFSSQPDRRYVALACALVAAAIGLSRLIVLAFDVGPDLDLLLFRQAVATDIASSRMGWGTATGLLLTGSALSLIAVRRYPVTAQGLAGATLLLSLVAMCGYLYGAVAYPDAIRGLPMALNTALALLLLSAGTLATPPADSFVRFLGRDSPGASLTRRLLPGAAALPIIVGAMRLVGEQQGLYDARLGVSLMAVTTIVLLGALILLTARGIDRADAQRQHAERQLREYAAEVTDLYDRAPCGYHTLDPRGIVQRMNETELHWLGYTADEVVGRLSFGDILTSESRAGLSDALAALDAEGRLDDREFDLVRRDGTTVPVSISATVIRDDSGSVKSSRFTVFDITDRRLADAQIRDMNLMLAQRIESLDVLNSELEAFSYSVSHDLRAPLRHVAGFAGLLAKHAAAQLDDRGRRYLETIVSATTSMGRLIDDLLAFSRMSRSELRQANIDLNRLVDEVRTSLQPEMEDREVEWQIESLPVVEGDEAMLRAVLANLLSNALKYTRPRSPAVVHVGVGNNGNPYEHHLFVRDNGVGFDMQYVDRLFGVFQRLHHADEFEGTGIGLATVRRVIARHGGRTWAEGVLDAGATVHFTLPAQGLSDSDAHQADSVG